MLVQVRGCHNDCLGERLRFEREATTLIVFIVTQGVVSYQGFSVGVPLYVLQFFLYAIRLGEASV